MSKGQEVCVACLCTEEAHGDESGHGRACPHECSGWFIYEDPERCPCCDWVLPGCRLDGVV
jgi:hypothetical protein